MKKLILTWILLNMLIFAYFVIYWVCTDIPWEGEGGGASKLIEELDVAMW